MSAADRPGGLRGAEAWVLVSAWCSGTGWVLSAMGQLNGVGYAVSFALALALGGLWIRRRSDPSAWRERLARAWRRRRFRRPMPALFLLALVLAGIGGALYEPNNFDTLTYRFPQVLHWLAAERWHWVETANLRVNFSAVGFSWMLAPLFVATHGARLFFLLNLASFALLPGLLFVFLRRAGVSGRTAWWWMWLLPLGYGYVLQAGSVGNDLFGTTYVVAAFAFALRARQTRAPADAWLSILAAALFTGVKVVSLPLLLPWAVAIAPALVPCLRHRLAASLLVLAVAAGVSILPSFALNIRHTGHWTGDPGNEVSVKLHSPLHGIVGNGLQLAVHNVTPPIFPVAGRWNAFVEEARAWPAMARLHNEFSRLTLRTNELAQEESAALGPGVTFLFVVTGLFGWFRLGSWRDARQFAGFWIGVCGWIAFAVYCAKVGSESGPRLLLGYYPVVGMFLLLPGRAAQLFRLRWWRWLAVLCGAGALLPLVLTPSRPLWPARTVLAALPRHVSPSPILERASTVYEIYAQRWDYLAPLRKHLPAVPLIGIFPGGDDSPLSLWRPFGARRVIEVTSLDADRASLESLRGSVLVASAQALSQRFQMTPAQAAAAVGGRIVGRESIHAKASASPEDWVVIRLSADAPTPDTSQEPAPGIAR